ncbi:MAG: arginine--tRNA ligase [Lentisphaerae bacterium]|nr:arginine--tRNA ligase [Lentisphaerota bacterium]
MTDTRDGCTVLGEIVADGLRAAFRAAFPDCGLDFASVRAAATQNPEFGDYQCNDCMTLARALKAAPRKIAAAVVGAGRFPECVDKAWVAGAGFINLKLKDDWLAAHVAGLAGDPRLGAPAAGTGKRIVMDYGGPNITKPLHIGHLRSPNIGSALDNMFRLLGYEVVSDSHLGDWGTQFGVTIMGYRHFGDKAAMEARPMEELERVYVRSYEKAKADPAWMDLCRRELVKLQAGDAANLALWKEFVELTRREVDRVYGRLGFRFDLVRGESFYHEMLQATVDRLVSEGIARESEGAIVAFLEEEKLPPAIVRKSDGGFNYATTDIATILHRVEEFDPEQIIYVHDERQQLHFRQVFAIARRLGVTAGLRHVWFGLMRLPEATFSTREGNVVRLEALLDEAERRALALVAASSRGFAEDAQREIARQVGIGAVKYADLSQNPQSLVTFTWEKALALEGNSGPYLQYARARIASVLDKHAERFPGRDPEAFPIVTSEAVERDLLVRLARFPETVAQAACGGKPSQLADYLYDLAQTYSTFYQNVPFLKSPDGIREARVRMCGITARVLERGLELLGIAAPKRL